MDKENLARLVRVCYMWAIVDILLAVLSAAGGSSVFVCFMLLGGMMGLMGAYFKKKLDEIGE